MYSTQELQAYVNRCLPVFGLTNWKVDVSRHPTEEDNWADIERAADALSTVVARLLPPVDVHSS
jgi:hypothetical protein